MSLLLCCIHKRNMEQALLYYVRSQMFNIYSITLTTLSFLFQSNISFSIWNTVYCLLFVVKNFCCSMPLPSFLKNLSCLPAFTIFDSIHVQTFTKKITRLQSNLCKKRETFSPQMISNHYTVCAVRQFYVWVCVVLGYSPDGTVL